MHRRICSGQLRHLKSNIGRMSYFHHTVKKGRIQNKGNKGRIQNKGNKIYHFCFLHYIYFYFVV
jgi:hypothetical protein